MGSPIPKHLRTDEEIANIPARLRNHVVDLVVDPADGVVHKGINRHPAKYAQGLATRLFELAGTRDLGDPMCGTGTLARETGLACALNDIDTSMSEFLDPLAKEQGCLVTYGSADAIPWSREVCIFSPPYYPRTDRKRKNAKNELVRGATVGFSDSYDCAAEGFIGNPSGSKGIAIYREAMTRVYDHMTSVCGRMIVVTKNWTRLGTELRLDLDTILMCEETGWQCVARHGFIPQPSLWSRFNAARGGGVQVEDILVFERK